VTVTEPKPKTVVFCQNHEEPGFLEQSEDGFAVRRLYLYSVKLHEQTDGRTNTHGNNVHRDRCRRAVSTSDVTATCGLCEEK